MKKLISLTLVFFLHLLMQKENLWKGIYKLNHDNDKMNLN